MLDLSAVEQNYRSYALYEKGNRSKTVKQTISVVKNLLEFSQVESLDEIETKQIRSFLHSETQTKKWSAKTFRNYRQCLKSFYSWAEEELFVAQNPVTPIKQPRLPIRLPRCLSNEEVKLVFERVRECEWYFELQGIRNEAILAVMTYGGMRFDEVRQLEEDYVDLVAREIRVKEGKNEKDRLIPIGDELWEILNRYMKARKKLGYPSKWFFQSVKSEKRLTAKNLHEFFKKVSKLAGFKVTAHMLRHTFGRLCVEKGINLRIIQTVMGHSDIRTTQIYTFVTSDATKQALKGFSLYENLPKI